jgi:hypothetical protein
LDAQQALVPFTILFFYFCPFIINIQEMNPT